MYTAVSWGALAAVAIGGTYYYTQKDPKKTSTGRRTFTPAQTRRRDSSKQRRDSRDRRRKDSDLDAFDQQDSDTTAAIDGSGQVKKRKGKKQQQQQQQQQQEQQSSSKLAQSSAVEASAEDEGPDDEDLEFARQLQDKIKGASLKKSDKPGQAQNKKARKQAKRAQEAMHNAANTNGDVKQETSTASSTTGADHDADGEEDRSSSTSLDLPYQPSGSNVADMLPPPSKGPSVLNITAPTQSQTPSHSKKPKPAQQEPESKKARQNRLKREAEKEAKAEDEKERQRLLEKQRRTAREARGEPAKNGLSGASSTPKTNAWNGPSSNGGVNGAGLGLLDTFDSPSSSVTKPERPTTNGKSHLGNNGYSSLPSEEEQLQLLKDNDDDGWNTVPSKAAGKKSKSQGQPGSQASTPKLDDGVNGGSSFPKGGKGTSVNAEANGVAALARDVPVGGKKPKGKGAGLVGGDGQTGEFWTARTPEVGVHGDGEFLFLNPFLSFFFSLYAPVALISTKVSWARFDAGLKEAVTPPFALSFSN